MYVTGSYRLTPRSTECKHLLKDSAFNSLQDRICLQNSLGGGGSKPILSHPSTTRYVKSETIISVLDSETYILLYVGVTMAAGSCRRCKLCAKG